MSIELPTKKIEPEHLNPRKMLIYSIPKAGKTTLLAELENNLILDLDNGSEFVKALKLVINNMGELRQVMRALIEGKKADPPIQYDYITIDTITKLEEIILPLAKELYRKTSMGKRFDYDEQGNDLNSQTVLNLPQGAGYLYLREAFETVRKALEALPVKGIIYLGHLKEKFLEKSGKEVISKDVDLTGKLKTILCADVDAIGYLYRSENKTYISFKTSDEILCGSRAAHLKNKEVLAGEMLESGEFKAHWENIFVESKATKSKSK